MKETSVYVIGSLRNPQVTEVAARLREGGFEVFDDWMAAGPEADDYWQKYEQARGNDFVTALRGRAARNVYNFDKANLDRCSMAVMVLPAGKSAHLELGYVLGKGKPAYIVLSGEPERFDVMYQFATGVLRNTDELVEALWYWK